MSDKQVEEAKAILQVLDRYFPKHFDGKESIRWLHKYSTQRRQDEWAAFFFEEYCFPLLTNFLGGWKGPRITKDKRFDYQRNYVWDLKLESILDKNGKKSSWIILNDKIATDRILNLEAGIGFVIAMVNFSFDIDGKLRKWRETFEKIPKKHTGPGKTRVLKKSGKVIEFKIVLLRNYNQIKEGFEEGWFGKFNQGRNSDGRPRPPKYMINMNTIPEKYVVKL